MDNEKIILPHHEQQSLCTTRLPYRQGRKLTAVKAYSITKESNHLLIFGVPSLNLRQETKALFLKFGKLLQFTISLQHPAEDFTETYHAQFEKIQSTRLAKRMLDTKNFYGGVLHVCYAPELETVNETKQKLFQRQRDVLFRLKNLQNETVAEKFVNKQQNEDLGRNNVQNDAKKLDMGAVNTIAMGQSKKRKKYNEVCNKKFKPIRNEIEDIEMPNSYNLDKTYVCDINTNNEDKIEIGPSTIQPDLNIKNNSNLSKVYNNYNLNMDNIEVVDCTSIDTETITNINEHLNYNKFGNEDVRQIPVKPLNRIKFNFNK